ncbi:hypothetical protein GPROT2_01650 [Gammaproteobacteria bacterium]|nr:DUF1330 domain-containing protein [Gammaproteobacteria bacterium]CAG0942310.1 hypothetical protein GPROT2_01650 [Gammaproteobacteria bacterium]
MSPPRCYMIIIARLGDRQRFLDGYARAVPPLVEKFGGRYVIRGSGGRFLEGGWCDNPSALVSEWPSKAAALAFWNSPEYAEAKKLREGAGDFQVLLIEAA